MGTIHRIYVGGKVVRDVSRFAKDILKRFIFIPCYEESDGLVKEIKIIEYLAWNADDEIRFLEFINEIDSENLDVGSISWKVSLGCD